MTSATQPDPTKANIAEFIKWLRGVSGDGIEILVCPDAADGVILFYCGGRNTGKEELE